MSDLEANRNRRIARAEIQLQELAQIPDGYQPPEQEAAVFQELAAKSISIFGLPGKETEGMSGWAAAQEEIKSLKAQVDSLDAELGQAKNKLALANPAMEQDKAEIERLKTEAEAEDKKNKKA